MEAKACGEGGAERAVAKWSCEEGDVADCWLLGDPFGAEGAGESSGWRGAGCWAGDEPDAWSVDVLDLPRARDPGAGWATFDTLLPQILGLA